MKILIVDGSTKLLFTRILFQNELGGQTSLIYKFSLAPGGRSGYSFGITQIDVSNNAFAGQILRDLEFTTDDSYALRNHLVTDLAPFNEQLMSHKDVVDKWDLRQVSDCLDTPISILADTIDYADTKAFLGIADYHNQFNMSKGGKMHRFLMSLTDPVTLENVRDFKLTLPWGQIDAGRHDIERRYNNIVAEWERWNASLKQ